MTDPSALAGLNGPQREAVAAPVGPTLVLAGAGSGKTRVITRRIAWRILETGSAPDSVLAVTFTNKAAREMKERVVALGVESVGRAWLGTFHSVGLRLLRLFGSEIGLPQGFAVLGEDDAKRLLRDIRAELGIEPELVTPRKLRSAVSRLKNAGGEAPPPRREEEHAIRAVFERYREELPRRGAVDFDDLILLPLELLRTSAEARRFVSRRAKVLLVDEYQDTSPSQNQLIRALAPGRDVFAVGDDDQSIYSFRGADYRNILRFEKDFPGARIFRLEDNYRSSRVILEAANAVISRNRKRHGKRLRATSGSGRAIEPMFAGGEAEIARRAAEEIERHDLERGLTAVLVRTRAQTRAWEEAFLARQIPHRVIGGLRFYERKEVQDALAHLRLALNPDDDTAFRRALDSLARGFGDKSFERIAALAAEQRVSLHEAAGSPGEGLPPRALAGLKDFLGGVERIRRAIEAGPVASIRATIQDSGLAARYETNDPERYENLISLESAAVEFEENESDATTLGFVDRVSLLSAEDFLVENEGGENGGGGPVLVMTVHAAKGLEFDTVFVGGLWEGVFPHGLSLGSEAGIEEERRLFYVAVTRARKSLYLLVAPGGSPWMRGTGGPSRFLSEIPRELLAGEAPAPVAGFRKGDRIRHRRFGEGRIESVETDGSRVTVLFRQAGRKRLVLAYAKLERI